MTSSEYRAIARERLTDNWGISILAALVAALLGGLLIGSGFSINIDSEILYELPQGFQMVLLWMTSISGILGVIQFIVGGVVCLGYCQFLLNQHDGYHYELKDLFSQFHRFGDGFCLSLLKGLYIFLWTLLLIIPGIVASYSYAMAPFIMSENPEMTASEALAASKHLMDGHKWDLFYLHWSFIGWSILAVLTCGIGYLWLNPYMNAANAAFYRDISDRVVALPDGE